MRKRWVGEKVADVGEKPKSEKGKRILNPIQFWTQARYIGDHSDLPGIYQTLVLVIVLRLSSTHVQCIVNVHGEEERILL